MKIKPVILCGGSGTRLFPEVINAPVKQFIDFGGWNLFEKTLYRIKDKIFDTPIISTNKIHIDLVLKVSPYSFALRMMVDCDTPKLLAASLLDLPALICWLNLILFIFFLMFGIYKL